MAILSEAEFLKKVVEKIEKVLDSPMVDMVNGVKSIEQYIEGRYDSIVSE